MAMTCHWSVRWVVRAAAVGLVAMLLLMSLSVHAYEPVVVSSSLQRAEQGARLSVRLDLKATHAVEQALLKGVPMYFVWRAETIRERWYWTDKREHAVSRVLKLAYQPLTRRWRLSVAAYGELAANGPTTQYALHQNFDSLSEALRVAGRVSNWKVADPEHIEDGELRVHWRFELDLSLLPRPFQLGMANEPDWTISVRQRMNLPSELQEQDVVPVHVPLQAKEVLPGEHPAEPPATETAR